MTNLFGNGTGTNDLLATVVVTTENRTPLYDSVYDIDDGHPELMLGFECGDPNHGGLIRVERAGLLAWARAFVRRCDKEPSK